MVESFRGCVGSDDVSGGWLLTKSELELAAGLLSAILALDSGVSSMGKKSFVSGRGFSNSTSDRSNNSVSGS